MNYYLSWLCGEGKQTWWGCLSWLLIPCEVFKMWHIHRYTCMHKLPKASWKKLTFFIIIKENSAIEKRKVYLPTINLKNSAGVKEFSTLLKSWRILSAQATVSQIWRMISATSSPGDRSPSCQSNASLFPISFKHPPFPFPASLARGLSFHRSV